MAHRRARPTVLGRRLVDRIETDGTIALEQQTMALEQQTMAPEQQIMALEQLRPDHAPPGGGARAPERDPSE
jgi:hypothetical protein